MEGIFNKQTKGMAFKGKDPARSKIVINNNIMEQTNKQTLSVISYQLSNPTFLIVQHVSNDTTLIITSQLNQRPAITNVCKSEAVNTVLEILMMRDILLESRLAIRNVGIINTITLSHLVS
jgi:hypothetical protein